MSPPSSHPTATSVYRLGRFIVPDDVRPAFVARLRLTRRVLDTLPGGCRTPLLERRDDPDGFGLAVLVEWADGRAVEAASAAMRASYAEKGFDPFRLIESLGVRAEFGLYREVCAEPAAEPSPQEPSRDVLASVTRAVSLSSAHLAHAGAIHRVPSTGVARSQARRVPVQAEGGGDALQYLRLRSAQGLAAQG